MNIFKPPHPIINRDHAKKSIFLAGSIEMGIAEDWQTRITQCLELAGLDVNIFNPRRPEWDASWEQSIEKPQFYQQVNWELNALEKCDIIFMYFAPDTKSPISLLELGLFARTGKMIVCCPKDFWRKGNVDIVCDRYNIPVYRSFDPAVAALIGLYEKISCNK